ncbi:MAG: anaerobic ribonucleoside-triphosphate reductase [Candidatus Norongarragalinales archaeon]
MAEEKESEPRCPHCGSSNVYGISRVVGYFSRINNWNKSKLAEFRDRQRGNYAVPASAAEVNKKFDSKIAREKKALAESG